MRHSKRYIITVFTLAIALLVGLFWKTAPRFEQAQSTLSIHFSQKEGYAEGDLAGQPKSGEAAWYYGDQGVPLDAFIVNEALFVASDANGGKSRHKGRWILYTFPIYKTGTLTVIWEWRCVGSMHWGFDSGFSICDSRNFNCDRNPASGWEELSAIATLPPQGQIVECVDGDGRGGRNYVAMNDVEFRDGRKITMRMVIDIDEQEYDVYARPEGGDEVLIGENCGFRRSIQRGLDTIAIWENAMLGGAGIWFDNIIITNGRHASPKISDLEPPRGRPASTSTTGEWWTVNSSILGYKIFNQASDFRVNKNQFSRDEKEAELVKAIFRIFLETKSLEATAQMLTEQQSVTKIWESPRGAAVGGEAFDAARVGLVLRNPVYLGLGSFNQEALIDRETYNHAQEILDSNP